MVLCAFSRVDFMIVSVRAVASVSATAVRVAIMVASPRQRPRFAIEPPSTHTESRTVQVTVTHIHHLSHASRASFELRDRSIRSCMARSVLFCGAQRRMHRLNRRRALSRQMASEKENARTGEGERTQESFQLFMYCNSCSVSV